jgi:hypothetical protein
MEYPVPPVTHVIYLKKITRVNKYHSRFKGDHFLILIHILKKKTGKKSELFVCLYRSDLPCQLCRVVGILVVVACPAIAELLLLGETCQDEERVSKDRLKDLEVSASLFSYSSFKKLPLAKKNGRGRETNIMSS